MKITMVPSGRFTGNRHTIADEKIKESSVSISEEGTIDLTIAIGPITTSGSFRGTLHIPLSELYHLVGLAEEKKLKLLKSQEKSLKELSKKLTK